MDVKALEYLIAIEEEGSISKAALKVHVTQSALSQCLGKIERELDCPLFLRVDRKLIPTNVGRIYLDGAKEIIDLKNELYGKIGRMVSGGKTQIRIAADPQMYQKMMEKWLPVLKAQYPETRFVTFIADSGTAKQYLLKGIVDAAFFSVFQSDNTLLTFYPLYEESLVFAVPNTLTAGQDLPLPYSVLKKLSYILPQAGTFFRPFLNSHLESKKLIPQTLYEAKDFPEMKKMMELGYGATFLPSKMTEDSSDYKTYPLTPPIRYQVALVLPKYTEIQAELDSLIQCCRDLS